MKCFFILLCLSIGVSACGAQTEANVTAEPSKQTSNKAKDTPAVREMLAAFQQQPHRIEFSGCEMRYNDKPFEIGMSVKELITIFGPYDLFNRGYYVWENAGIVFVQKSREEVIEKKTDYIYIYLNDFENNEGEDDRLKHELYKNQDIFLWNGIPITKDLAIGQLLANSTYELTDFVISDTSYKMYYPCAKDEVLYYLGTRNNWFYKGGGHLRFKSHINPNNPSKIDALFIKKITENNKQ